MRRRHLAQGVVENGVTSRKNYSLLKIFCSLCRKIYHGPNFRKFLLVTQKEAFAEDGEEYRNVPLRLSGATSVVDFRHCRPKTGL